MGMYTQLVMGVSIIPNKYPEIKPILDCMLDWNKEIPELPDHEFFKCDRWRQLFTSDSFYFDFKTHSKVTTYDFTDTVHLTIVSNLKNYSNEINHFIAWITPYLDNHDGEFLGFCRYEENARPALIFKNRELEYV